MVKQTNSFGASIMPQCSFTMPKKTQSNNAKDSAKEDEASWEITEILEDVEGTGEDPQDILGLKELQILFPESELYSKENR